MKNLAMAAAIAIAAVEMTPQNTGENKHVITGRITSAGTGEGISGVDVTLRGGPWTPVTPETLSRLYTPSPALTPEMRAEIDRLVIAASGDGSVEAVANLAARREAQLLGLPEPQYPIPAPPIDRKLATTADDGRFSFENLAPGRYIASAERPGYFGPPEPCSTARLPTATTPLFVLDGNNPAQAVSLSLTPTGAISGTVRDSRGRPVPDVLVWAYQLGYGDNGRLILDGGASKVTNDRGAYRIFGLLPGEYYVGAAPSREETATDTWIRTFFPSTTEPLQATRITLGDGVDVDDVNIGIQRGATAKVSGRVTGLVKPIAPPMFHLVSRDSNMIEVRDRIDRISPTGQRASQGTNIFPNIAANQERGEFEIRSVPPGSYYLLASVSAPSRGSPKLWGRVLVDVGLNDEGNPRDVTNIAMTMRPGNAVKVRVTIDGAPPVVPQTVSGRPIPIRLTLQRKEWSGVTIPGLNAPIDSSGEHTFDDIPEGAYNIRVSSLPANAYVSDIRAGGVSVFQEGFMIDSRSNEIQVLVESNGGGVTGSVTDGGGMPAGKALVILAPHESRRQNPALFKAQCSDDSGQFAISGVAPGAYKLFAWENAPTPSSWMNSTFMAEHELRGNPVTVLSGTSINTDVKVIPKQR